MKRFYYSLTNGDTWEVVDRLKGFGSNGTVCRVSDAEIADIICDALNTKYPATKPEAPAVGSFES